jgi:hypothetical protein
MRVLSRICGSVWRNGASEAEAWVVLFSDLFLEMMELSEC